MGSSPLRSCWRGRWRATGSTSIACAQEPTDTPLFATLPEKIRDGLVKSIPFRRLAKPEEVADAVVFFASSRSDFITGQALSVSGGLTMAGERWSTSSLPC